MVKDKIMKSFYVMLTEDELKMLKNDYKQSKSTRAKEMLLKLDYTQKVANKDNKVYLEKVMTKFQNLNSDLVKNEEIVVDDDAIVSSDKNGAYVQCWAWVDNDIKVKKTRKRVTKNG
jgi:hypothetical protein